MDEIKEAFLRVRSDIDFLYQEVNSVREDLKQTRDFIVDFGKIISDLKESVESLKRDQNTLSNRQTDRQTDTPTGNATHLPTENTQNKATLSDISTHSTHIKPLKYQNSGISIGNEGVPTDRQTDRQTNQQTHFSSHNLEKAQKNTVEEAIQIIDSLDSIKKEIRLKFKRLTDQEMTVFTILYQLSEEDGFTDYRSISLKLNLTESSIRDYIGRLIRKGVPVDKTKINNKSIQLSVSPNFKKVASLQTVLELRNL